MPKFRVHAVYTASKYLGEIEAETEEAAKEAAWEMDYYVGLCHQCGNEVELNDDPYEMQADKIEESTPDA